MKKSKKSNRWKKFSAAESTIINGTMIIWIPLLAVLFLQETLTRKEMAGLVIVALGTFIVQYRRPRI